jgi:ATP-dependent RNA helicase DeaD
MGFVEPSPIQVKTLPVLLDGPTDFLGLAATGTGKTAAFGLPVLQHLDFKIKGTQALILCPTRELALQVASQIDLMGKDLRVKTLCIYGGTGYREQLQGLKSHAQIVIGTPGRVIDHLERGTLRLDQVRTLILDEADEMISMGFREDLERVMSTIDREFAKIWLFSATMSGMIRKLVDRYLVDFKQVQINKESVLSSTVEQQYYVVREGDRNQVLCKIIDHADDFYGIIFCQTKAEVAELQVYLTGQGYKVDCLHGDKNQKDRERAMQAFRDKKVKILVCTDVAARGLDVKEVSHVINYSIPRELESYIHRIGRTARSGSSGLAMSFVSPRGKGIIYRIEKMTKSRMIEGRIPTRKEIGLKKVSKLLPTFREQTQYERATNLLSEDWKKALDQMSKEEVAGRFLSLMEPDVFGVVKVSGPTVR